MKILSILFFIFPTQKTYSENLRFSEPFPHILRNKEGGGKGERSSPSSIKFIKILFPFYIISSLQ